MRIRTKHYLVASAIVLLSLPVWARTKSASFTTTESFTESGKQINPGDYTVKVKDGDTQFVITKDGEVVYQGACHWIQLKTKSSVTQVQFNANGISEIDFSGDTQAVQVP